MPSPFPGMDPFLEHPVFFQDLHGTLHGYFRETLQPVLPEPYFAAINERHWVDDEHTEMFVEVRTRMSDDTEWIATTIEVLSPSNKTPGEKDRNLYLEKQREILHSESHLVEIDLLRGGEHTTPMSLKRLRQCAGAFDYHVSVHRFNKCGDFFIYPWKLEDPLPVIAIPLLPGDGEVPLDLQAVFARCYDTGPYRRRLRYDVSRLDPPLDTQRAEWARKLIAGSGCRT